MRHDLPMTFKHQTYCVDGIVVVLVRDQNGARWECSQCSCDCEHALKAAAWMTVASWSDGADQMH